MFQIEIEIRDFGWKFEVYSSLSHESLFFYQSRDIFEFMKGSVESGRVHHLNFTFLMYGFIPHFLFTFMYSLIGKFFCLFVCNQIFVSGDLRTMIFATVILFFLWHLDSCMPLETSKCQRRYIKRKYKERHTTKSIYYCNMNLKASSLAAIIALFQFESHIG